MILFYFINLAYIVVLLPFNINETWLYISVEQLNFMFMSKNTTLLIYIGVKMSIKYIYKDRFKL